MICTFLDAGVLIAAANFRQTPAGLRAFQVLDDPEREFVSSVYVQLELLPKANYHRRTTELEFYNAFFDAVVGWADDLDEIAEHALREASRNGLSAMDALHVAAAVTLGADELVTTEKRLKPIFRTRAVHVVSIDDL